MMGRTSGKAMTRSAKELLSVKAPARMFKIIIDTYFNILLVLLAFTTCLHNCNCALGKPYGYDGKRRLMMQDRILNQGTCTPILLRSIKESCGVMINTGIWNMENRKGEPYFSNCVQTENCTRPNTNGYVYSGEDSSNCLI